jgi:hypothetical protein
LFDFIVGSGATAFSGSSFLFNNTTIVTENAVLLETVVLSFAISFIVGLLAVDNWNVNVYFFRMAAIKLYVDKFVNSLNLFVLRTFYFSFILVDKGILELFGPVFAQCISVSGGRLISKFQSGSAQFFFVLFILSIFFVVVLLETQVMLSYVFE